LTKRKTFIKELINFLPHIVDKIKQAGVLVIGGSAGSFEHIQNLVSILPANFSIPVVIVIHRGRQYTSILEGLFQERSEVNVKEAEDKERMEPGNVYIAPVDYHLLVEQNGVLSLDVSEPLWYSRPSIDVLFESAADSYGDKAMGMLFSGASEDGANGLAMIRQLGGLTLAQHPDEAEFSIMPKTAIAMDAVDLVFHSDDITYIINEIRDIKKRRI
jgi:two-component system chemotaxis response regulator CheB